MKARILYLIAAALCLCSCGTAKKNVVDVTKYPNRAEMIVAQMHDPASKYVVVACHRGDWRNYPENSIEELGVTDQILIKGKKPVAEVAGKMAAHERNMMYMPIIDIQKEAGKKLFNEYMETGTVPLAYEVCWRKMTPEVEDCFKKIINSGSKLWINTIWGSLCGYLDDDKALDCGDPALIYDQVIGYGASLIQTDRPEQLLKYLRSKGLHD